jgi:uncharacterized protein
MRFICKCLIVIAALMAAANAWAMAAHEVPNPRVETGSFVEDSAGVLGSQYIAIIDDICKELESKTSAELAVVTVDNLGGLTVEDFAGQLFKRFGIGKKEKDNGLLILFSLDDRKVRIEVGYGLESVINDAKAGRMLDEYAIPKFKEGQYGRGLYDLTKAAAIAVANSSGVKLATQDPAEFPVQQESPAAMEVEPLQEQLPPLNISLDKLLLIYIAVFGGISLGLIFLQTYRVYKLRAKAAKQRMFARRAFIPLIVWLGGGLAMIALSIASETIMWLFVSYAASGTVLTTAYVSLRKHLKKYIDEYQCECSKCHKPMQIVGFDEDDSFLKPEEIAEEKAGGMDYEFWRCKACDRMERFDVKLPKASKCPKCSRRTVKSTDKVLTHATTTQAGRKLITLHCFNPKCNFHEEKEQVISKISSSSASGGSSSSSSSGGSSFGGGSSGGGGSSRGW